MRTSSALLAASLLLALVAGCGIGPLLRVPATGAPGAALPCNALLTEAELSAATGMNAKFLAVNKLSCFWRVGEDGLIQVVTQTGPIVEKWHTELLKDGFAPVAGYAFDAIARGQGDDGRLSFGGFAGDRGVVIHARPALSRDLAAQLAGLVLSRL